MDLMAKELMAMREEVPAHIEKYTHALAVENQMLKNALSKITGEDYFYGSEDDGSKEKQMELMRQQMEGQGDFKTPQDLNQSPYSLGYSDYTAPANYRPGNSNTALRKPKGGKVHTDEKQKA